MISEIAREVLPKDVLQWVSRWRQRKKLFAYPQSHFSSSNLLPKHALDFQSILTTPEIAHSWMQDIESIKAAYGDRSLGYGVNPGDRRALYHLIRWLRPSRVLETGTHIGLSTAAIAMALKRNGYGTITTVDILDVNASQGPWREVGLSASPQYIAHHLLGCSNVDFVSMPAQKYMSACQHTYDFIFLDGDHTPAGVYAEIAMAMKLLTPGGLILLHDYHEDRQSLGPTDDFIEGPYIAMRRIARENPQIMAVPLGELPWETKETKRGNRWTSLAAIVAS